jgi:hypothetical protein
VPSCVNLLPRIFRQSVACLAMCMSSHAQAQELVSAQLPHAFLGAAIGLAIPRCDIDRPQHVVALAPRSCDPEPDYCDPGRWILRPWLCPDTQLVAGLTRAASPSTGTAWVTSRDQTARRVRAGESGTYAAGAASVAPLGDDPKLYQIRKARIRCTWAIPTSSAIVGTLGKGVRAGVIGPVRERAQYPLQLRSKFDRAGQSRGTDHVGHEA